MVGMVVFVRVVLAVVMAWVLVVVVLLGVMWVLVSRGCRP